MAVSLRMTNTGQPAEEAPFVPGWPHVWGKHAADPADDAQVNGGQPVVPGSGTHVPGAGQGERRQSMVARSGGDKSLESKDRQ